MALCVHWPRWQMDVCVLKARLIEAQGGDAPVCRWGWMDGRLENSVRARKSRGQQRPLCRTTIRPFSAQGYGRCVPFCIYKQLGVPKCMAVLKAACRARRSHRRAVPSFENRHSSCSRARARASPRSTHANEASPRSLCLSASYFKEFIALDDGIHTTDLHFVRANSSNLERSSSSRQQQRNKAGRDQQFDHASPGERARHAP